MQLQNAKRLKSSSTQRPGRQKYGAPYQTNADSMHSKKAEQLIFNPQSMTNHSATNGLRVHKTSKVRRKLKQVQEPFQNLYSNYL